MNISCICCRKELPETSFFPSAQKRFRRGRIKASLCVKCHKKTKKQALITAEKQLESGQNKWGQKYSERKLRGIRRKAERLRYSLVINPRLLSAKRRARLLLARPKWVRAEWFKDIYTECARRERETGIKHHVDHIVPLQGEFVSGLDVPWNLQVLTASENCSKSNKFQERGQ